MSANNPSEFVCINSLDVVSEQLELEDPLGVVVLPLQRVLHGRELVLVVRVPHAEERTNRDLQFFVLFLLSMSDSSFYGLSTNSIVQSGECQLNNQVVEWKIKVWVWLTAT